jgi:branched-chain amino acid transport system substrate-binding protein
VKRHLIAAVVWILAGRGAMADIGVAVVGPMKGPNAVFGEQMRRGAEAAVAAVNAAGGINDELLRLEVVDDGCDAKQAVARAQELLAKDVRFIDGHFCSAATMAAAKIYEAQSIVVISPTATLPALTEDAGWNIQRLASRDDGQADVAVARIRAQFPSVKVALLDDGQILSAGIAARFKAAFGSDLYVLAFKPGEDTYKGLANDLRDAGIGLVYFACTAGDAGKIAAQIRDVGLTVQLMGSDGLLVEDYWANAGEGGEGTLVTFAADPMQEAAAKDIVAAFQADGFVPEGATLPSYAAVQAFVAAAKATDVNKGQDMAAWLRAGNVFDTVLGSLKLDAKGDVTPPRFAWYQWSAGQYAVEPQP